MNQPDPIQDRVAHYYGKVIGDRKDLTTSTCCSAAPADPRVRAVLEEIEPEVREKSYGCGSSLPPLLEGMTVLDLGCGTGRDAFIASRLVGPDGRVIGVDITEEQISVGRRNLDAQMKRFGYARPNVKFEIGFIEDLESLGIATDSVDVVVSNCVINLSPEKERVFSEIFRVLKPGGELFFADVFADRRVPEALRGDPLLYNECLSGALYTEDFRRILLRVGCPDYRVVSASRVSLIDSDILQKIGAINFYSITIRAFKLDDIEDRCEDFGQTATYLGTIPDHPHAFELDAHHLFETGRPMRVCGNSASMVQHTRYGAHFEVQGDHTRHFGLFDCGCGIEESASDTPGGCC